MKRTILIGLLLCANAWAAEVDFAGIHLVDKIQVGNTTLQLNGGGIRTKWFFKIYVGALYLTHKQASADAIIADEHEHRVIMYILHELSGKKMYEAFEEAIEDNHSAAELKTLDAQMQQMKQVFESVSEVKPGDVVSLDYVPATGTKIIVNGTERGVIAGTAFNRALLRIWLGKNPVQEDLKKGMLGG